MAPGIGGNGGGPRQTGTVPKTKSHNEASREYNGATRRDYHPFNHVHMPNNLSSLDWQPVNESLSHPRTRKESNTSASRFSESFDAEENGVVTQDNLWFNAGQRNQAYNSDDDEVSQASWAENGYKSNNLGLPDKSQVASRLHQIRDYVNQTVTMMEGLRATGGQRNMAQHEKLSSMLEGLRDSELKLQNLYERLQRMPVSQPKGDAENFPTPQMMDAPRERTNKSVASTSKSSEAARKNELKKQVQISQLKLQELQEQQATLKALKLKAQEQLNEARAAQGALMAAHGVTQAAANTDNMVQERLHNLQRFFDTRQQIAGLEDEEADATEVQNKLDELQAKKQHMDQLLAQFSNLHSNVANNVSDELTPEECERDVQNKMAELNAMKEFLTTLQNSATQLRPLSPQERVVKNESRGGSIEKTNAPTSQALHAKTQQLNEAKARLQQLQNLLQTVEEMRSCGQPIPESVLRLMNGSDHSSSPTQQDRSDMSSQDLNVSQGASERLVNSCERAELFERGCRSINSCERERAKQQPAANTAKHNNQEGKVGLKIQLEELIRNQELNLPQPLQSSSFQENGTTIGTWGGSTQSTLDEGYNPDYSGDLTETTSVKNAASTSQPHNMWRKPSTGSASRYSWSSPYVPQEVRRGAERPERPPCPPVDIPPQPDSHWVVHQISQLQNQLQQMSGLYKNFVEKQQNCPPPWLTPPISSALGPYCQYIASAGQWQQQQLLVQSLNQCCQLIWHQQRELAALKETLSQLHHPAPDAAQFSPQLQADASSTPPSNLGRAHDHVTPKPSLSGPTLAPPAVVSSAHSLPNLASPQSPPSPPPINNRNLLASPTATVLSLPPSLNNTNHPNPNIFFNPQSQFTDPNFINLYPPYGNNLNFEFPSPVNFFPNPPEPFLPFHPQPQPATTLNNQVPPGNRANNYWDNFRSYSRQNLLSNSGKSNDGLPQAQRTPMERFLNTDPAAMTGSQPPHPRSRKDRIVGGEVNQLMTRAQVHQGEEVEGEASGYQYNLALPSHGRQQAFSPHNNTYTETEGGCARGSNECERPALHGARLVNDCEAPRGANKKPYAMEHCALPSSGNKRNYADIPAREAKISQLNNYHTEPPESNTEADSNSRAINLPRRHPRNVNSICDNSSNNLHHQQQQNCIGDGFCLMASDKGVRRKDNRGNVTKDCKTDTNSSGDSLEECVYSEVAALISVNEWRPQYLLQLFKDLRLLSSCPDPGMQATLSSTIHALASRTSQEEHRVATAAAVGVNEETATGQTMAAAAEYLGNFSHQPQPPSRSQKEAPAPPPPPPPQLPPNCAKLDWEVRSVLTEMLPFIKSQVGEVCGPALLESVRRLILHLVPAQASQDQLDGQLEDALHKFHGCRLGDVYEELLTVVADVLISELTFLRLVNTVHHNHATEQQNGEVLQEGEEEDEEGAVGGAVGEVLSPSLITLHPANQTRRNKSEPVSEADLAEADQSRHTVSGGEEEVGDTAEGIDQSEEEASSRELSVANCNGNMATESKTEACWAVEQDRELGLDQVPTRLHNCEADPEVSHPAPAASDPGPGSSI